MKKLQLRSTKSAIRNFGEYSDGVDRALYDGQIPRFVTAYPGSE